MLGELRGAAGEIEHLDLRVRVQQLEHSLGSRTLESLAAIGTGLHVAVVAREVAAPGDVHLERAHRPPTQRREPLARQPVREDFRGNPRG